MLGLLRAQQGRFLEAVKAIAHALKISPRSEQALVNFGNVLRALGQNDQALLSYDTALSVNDKAPAGYRAVWEAGPLLLRVDGLAAQRQR